MTIVMIDNVEMITMEKQDLVCIVRNIVADSVLDASLELLSNYTPEAEDDADLGRIIDNILVADDYSLQEALLQIRHGIQRKDFPGIVSRLLAFKYSCESQESVNKELEGYKIK